MLGAKANVGIGCEMHHQLRTVHRVAQAFQVEQVALHERELRMDHGAVQEPPLPGRKVIEPDNAVSRGKKAIHHVAANKASCTRN